MVEEKVATKSRLRFWLAAASLLFMAGAGYRSGAAVRVANASSSLHHAGGIAGGMASLRGNLSRMIALRPGSGDEQLGMEGDAFPATLNDYWGAVNTISTQFFNPTPLSLFTPAGQAILGNPQKFRTHLTYSAIQGVMSSLDDPYTRFLDPTAFREMQQDNTGSFAGIGAQLMDKNGKIVIIKALPDTPAEAAKILPMDEIIAINGRSTEKMLSDNAVKLIRGRPGTIVELTLRRAGKPLTVRLVRTIIRVEHFESHVVSDNIGYIHLMMFDEQAADNIERAMQGFRREGIKAVILDLRDNPGGLLNAAVDVASKFIPPGTVVWVQERGGQRSSMPTNGDARREQHLPLVVLVNHYSASASEIVSGAVKDTHAGTLMGLTTWGKGLVQEVIPLNDNSAIALTTAHYFTPSGSDINLKGVKPDIIVGHNLAEPDSDTQAEIDKLIKDRDAVDKEQLDAAIALLRKRIGPAPSPTPVTATDKDTVRL